MLSFTAVVLSVLLSLSWSEELTFPPKFMFGAASSAYQVEGGWNAADKSENVWDHFLHEHPELIADGSNGDVACDSYHLWRRDIEVAKELGLDYYRFSISWARLLPNGFSNYISKDGVNYYNNLINGLLENNIQPFITIYHYELPLIFQDLGGWTNPLIVDWFADYARVVYTLFGDRVKMWLTVNEPLMICDGSYMGVSPTGVISPDHAVFLCSKYVILAHAKVWRIYDEEFKPKYHGKVSVSQLFLWFEPETEADAPLVELANELVESRFTHPIYSKEGGWPPALNKILEENSYKKGFKKSRVLAFTPDEIEFVKGTYDFYALNHYTTFKVRAVGPNETAGDWPFTGSKELGAIFRPDPAWKLANPFWFALLLAIQNDGINITAYTVWSMIDSFEWLSGYTDNYGLYQVDFSSPNKTRTPKASATYYRDIIRNHGFRQTSKTNFV